MTICDVVYMCPFHILNRLIDFYETWHEPSATDTSTSYFQIPDRKLNGANTVRT
jgi:hypothetical protein